MFVVLTGVVIALQVTCLYVPRYGTNPPNIGRICAIKSLLIYIKYTPYS